MPVDQTLQWRRHRTRILVLGASGRLGRALGHRICCEKRAARPVEVIWQTRQTRCTNARAPGTTLIWDILNEDSPVDLRVDIVLCLAGVVPHSAANLALNSDLAQSALDVGHRSGANHVFLISSAAVYGTGPFGEDTDPQPISPYGRAKLQMEQMALSWRATAPLDAPGLTILRIGNVAGADSVLGPGPRHVALDAGPNGESMRRSFIGPNRLSDMLLDLCQMAASGVMLPQVLNVALSPSVSLKEILQRVGWQFSEIPKAGLKPIEVELQTQNLARLGLCPDRNAQAADILDDLISARIGRDFS